MVKIVIELLTPSANEVARKNHVALEESIANAIKGTKLQNGNNENYHFGDGDFAVNTTPAQ